MAALYIPPAATDKQRRYARVLLDRKRIWMAADHVERIFNSRRLTTVLIHRLEAI